MVEEEPTPSADGGVPPSGEMIKGSSSDGKPGRVSNWDRIRFELRPSYGMCSLDEPPLPVVPRPPSQVHATASPPPTAYRSRRIDVAKSFAPHNYLHLPFSIKINLTPAVRLFLLYWSCQVLYVDVTTYPPHNLYIYMGYLTHWGHVLSTLYLACSLLCSLCPSAVRQPSLSTAGTIVDLDSASTADVESVGERVIASAARDMRVSGLVRWTWLLYSTVAPLEVCITLLYWSAVADGNPQGYVSVMEHGGVCALVLLDGAAVGIVPVRMKQVVHLIVVCGCYLTWTAINYALGIGNGEWGPAYGDDDALYPVLNWGEDGRKLAGWLSAFCVTVLTPAVFWAVWMLSLLGGWKRQRQLIDQEEAEDGDYGRRDRDDEDTMCRCCRCCCCCCSRCHWDGSRRPLFEEPSEQPVTSSRPVTPDDEAFGYRNLEGDAALS